MSSKPSYVLDASAALALLFDEPGAEKVEQRLGRCVMSVLNWGEVVQICTDRGTPPEQYEADFRKGLTAMYSLELDDVTTAAKTWADTKTIGLSLADRVCLVLAKRLSLTALTSDRAWSKVKGVKVETIR